MLQAESFRGDSTAEGGGACLEIGDSPVTQATGFVCEGKCLRNEGVSEK